MAGSTCGGSTTSDAATVGRRRNETSSLPLVSDSLNETTCPRTASYRSMELSRYSTMARASDRSAVSTSTPNGGGCWM